MGMEFLAILAVFSMRTQFLEKLWGKIELVMNIWTFIRECPELLNSLDEKANRLEQKLVALCSIEEDINTELESANFQPQKKRKREVEAWLINVQRKKSDIESIKHQIGKGKQILRPWLESHVQKNIKEVEELYEQGQFPQGLLLLDAHPTSSSRDKLLTTRLFGGVSTKSIMKGIWECLISFKVLRIGVYGVEGVGKTAILMHIHNKLLESTSPFDHVYWITMSQHSSIHKLQNDIAKEVGLDFLDENDIRKRAAKLFKALTMRERTVLILDEVWKHFLPEEVGIPNKEDECKLILSTRSIDVCRKMNCHETIEVKPLSDEEAEKLFMEKLGQSKPLAPAIEEIAKLIIKQCGGLPLLVIEMAQRMRGVDDICEWRNALNEAREFRRGLND